MGALPGVSEAGTAPRRRRVKNIIFCVSDGMSAGVPSMLDHYLQNSHGKRSPWRLLQEDPEAVHGLMDTRSLSSMVTDSAAAASSWGSGVHVLNGAINTLPGVGELTPLYTLLGEHGMKRGLVTTCTMTHATPSGFAVATKSRTAEPVIARQYRDRGVEVLLGGGTPFFDPSLRADKMDVFGEYASDGYTVCKNKSELTAAQGRSSKLLGIFSSGQMPYTIDHINDPALMASTPSLAEMTQAALAVLKGSRNGFILQVEGGRVDHAAHANDLGAILRDQMAFEEALEVVLEFARDDEETLVVVTSDHGNANPGITGKAEMGKGNGLNLIDGMKASFESIMPTLKEAATAPAIQDVVEAKLGIKITAPQAQAILDAAGDKSPLAPFGNYRHATAALALVLSGYTGVGWTSGSHTSDYTIITSLGPGADLFSGMVQNTSVFGRLLSLRGLKHSNPTATLEQAQAAQEREKSLTAMAEVESDVHWV